MFFCVSYVCYIEVNVIRRYTWITNETYLYILNSARILSRGNLG
jgi:chromate transport protein ChrA